MLVLRGAVYGSSMPKTQEVYPEVQVRIRVFASIEAVLQELLGDFATSKFVKR
jgi:hypothetical protein